MDFLQKIHLNYNVKNERVHVRQLPEGKRTFQGKARKVRSPWEETSFYTEQQQEGCMAVM